MQPDVLPREHGCRHGRRSAGTGHRRARWLWDHGPVSLGMPQEAGLGAQAPGGGFSQSPPLPSILSHQHRMCLRALWNRKPFSNPESSAFLYFSKENR